MSDRKYGVRSYRCKKFNGRKYGCVSLTDGFWAAGGLELEKTQFVGKDSCWDMHAWKEHPKSSMTVR